MAALSDKIQQYANTKGLSDIHVHAGHPLALRIHGDIIIVEETIFGIQDIEIFAKQHLSQTAIHKWHEYKSLDTEILCGQSRFRTNFYFSMGKPTFVMRCIESKIQTLQELGLPESIKQCLENNVGLILVSGATGSGKSTSLAAMAQYLISTRAMHFLTIEDPIEYRLSSTHSVISQRQIGVDTQCFTSALHAALREDPDAILIGEMRDTDTMQLVLTAAECGHLVMTSLHASSCAGTLDRIINSFPAQFRNHIRTQLAASLNLIINQRLLKRSDNKARVVVYEILIANHAVRNLIREDKIFHLQSVIETSYESGMMSMDACINSLRMQGILEADVK